jgi:hypothetical protein
MGFMHLEMLDVFFNVHLKDLIKYVDQNNSPSSLTQAASSQNVHNGLMRQPECPQWINEATDLSICLYSRAASQQPTMVSNSYKHHKTTSIIHLSSST